MPFLLETDYPDTFLVCLSFFPHSRLSCKSPLLSSFLLVTVAYFCISWMNYDVSHCVFVWRQNFATHTHQMVITASLLLKHAMLTCRSSHEHLSPSLCVELIFRELKKTSGEQQRCCVFISLLLWIQHRWYKLTHVV